MNAITKALMVHDAFNSQREFVSDAGMDLFELIRDHARWSQETFGKDDERDCIGPLEHLKKEIEEVKQNPADITEWADMFLLYLDGLRRAGIGFPMLLEVARRKHEHNKTRKWNKAENGKPSEHVRDKLEDAALQGEYSIRLDIGKRDKALGVKNKYLIVRRGRVYMLVMPTGSLDDPIKALEKLLDSGAKIPYVE